ncbi:fibronectin type III domain-containing protein [Oscillochloris trichoides DG-6]|uniref:Fibronectin type III domain-containing protein n=1 Tax=Oscillochloris trichoides DG-6 TaxID=765420 RepID=E1IET2_9CHLR|nr:PA14 domain-containing protein [Oscillochloris trichoides]EFO80305.1 fibronectin type III domain-containing protein [Oscillochloris trichoides DG-6]
MNYSKRVFLFFIILSLILNSLSLFTQEVHASIIQTLPVPYMSQYTGATTENDDCGPSSVAMVLDAYNKRPPTILSNKLFIEDIRKKMSKSSGATSNNDRIVSLAAYGINSTAITGSDPLSEIKVALAQYKPVIARVNGRTLGRGYDGHAIVVIGFSGDGQSVYVHDPDNRNLTGWRVPGGATKTWPYDVFKDAVLAVSSPYGLIVEHQLPPSPFAGQSVAQSYQNTMMAGSTQTVQVQVKNIGTATWDSSTRIAPVPRDQASPFYDPATWQSTTRIMSAGSVAPGQTKVFEFVLRAPSTPGHYNLQFGFLQESVTWFSQPADGAISFQIHVTYPVGEGSSRAQLFRDAYNRKGGTPIFGYPTNSAHWWGDGSEHTVIKQDFQGGTVGNGAIIHDEKRDTPINSVPAYVIHGGIWQTYLNLGGWQSWLGPVTSDEFQNAAGQAQSNFRNGYIVWNNGNPQIVPWPEPIQGQWRAEYRNGGQANLHSYPTWVRNETSINYDWGTNTPGSGKWGVWGDHFSVRWTGQFSFVAGDYTFITTADDGIRVWIDGNLIIDRWEISSTEYRVSRTMTAGAHDIKVEYYDLEGAARAQFRWEPINRVPATPSNLRTGTTSQTSITLHWQDNATNEEGYKLYKWDGIAGNWILVANIGANTTQYTDTALTCASTYYYEVKAYNSSGESNTSGWIEVATSVCNASTYQVFLPLTLR